MSELSICEKYIELFASFGVKDENFWQQSRDEIQEQHIMELFDAVAAKMSEHNDFNDSLPDEFVGVLRRYDAGAVGEVIRFDDFDKRLFCLSDLFDYLLLYRFQSRRKK